MTVRIDPRKLFEGDNDLRQYLETGLDLDKLFGLVVEHRALSMEKQFYFVIESMVINLIEEALPKFIEVELYEER